MRNMLLGILLVFITFTFICCDDDDDNNPVTTPPDTSETLDTTVVSIGGLLPFTGNLSQYAPQLNTFIHFAQDDANEILRTEESEFRLELICDDTETEGETATLLAEYMHRISDINCFIGPLTSAELLTMTESTILDSVLVLSPGSTAPSLSVPDDNIFRFVTSDSQMATALSQKMWDDGIRALLTVHRTDTWGDALSELVGEAFIELGGQLIEDYEFYGSRRSEITYMLDSLYVDLASITLPVEQIGLQLTSLEEGIELFATVSDSIANYPLMDDIRWYGSDGFVQNSYLVAAEGIRELAAEVQYTAPIFGLTESSEMAELANRFAEVSDDDPWTYSYIAYDIVMLAGKAIGNISDPDDLSELRTEILDLSETYEGITGPMSLNDNGDRETGTYDFWQVVEEGSSYSWVKID